MSKGVNENTLNVLVFGINGGYGHSYIKTTISNKLDLYENCKAILDKITNDYHYNVYLGYKDYIRFDNNIVDKINDTELVQLLHSNDVNNSPLHQIDFNKQNTKYLNMYKLTYQFSLENTLGIIYGLVSPTGIFNYDKQLLDSNDDTDFSTNDDCSSGSVDELFNGVNPLVLVKTSK